ncbi:MAG TPA: hypothetical protein VMQ83_02385 [Gammaproteobacteria bacterium]|nr:hypothetical protein [Gammaproteobacteria bacterium]
MAGPQRKRPARRARLPILPPPLAGRMPRQVPAGVALGSGDEDSIYTLRGYKAWAARVKAAWDAES